MSRSLNAALVVLAMAAPGWAKSPDAGRMETARVGAHPPGSAFFGVLAGPRADVLERSAREFLAARADVGPGTADLVLLRAVRVTV